MESPHLSKPKPSYQMVIIAQLFQKRKLFQYNIFLAQQAAQFFQHTFRDHTAGSPALPGVCKEDNCTVLTGEHI